MQNANDAVIEFLLNQLRQQLTNNPYKQQCEDLAHEVLSLKNQLRDASALVAELQKELEAQKAIAEVYMDALAEETRDEQSGCRKEDTQECPHSFYYVVADGSAPFGTKVCKTCKRYF